MPPPNPDAFGGRTSPDFASAYSCSLADNRLNCDRCVIFNSDISHDDCACTDRHALTDQDRMKGEFFPLDDMRNDHRAIAYDRVVTDLHKLRIHDDAGTVCVPAELCSQRL